MVTETRYPNLAINRVALGIWQIIQRDEITDSWNVTHHTGPNYRTKIEAFSDLSRIAKEWGYE